MQSHQKFVAVHSSIRNHFNVKRALTSREDFSASRAAALAEWRQLSAARYRAGLGKQRLVRIRLTTSSRLVL